MKYWKSKERRNIDGGETFKAIRGSKRRKQKGRVGIGEEIKIKSRQQK